MTVSHEEVMASLPPERRARIEERAAVLMDQHETLVELRKARKLTWATLASIKGEDPESIYAMERQADVLLTAMSGYVEAMGGSLKLVAEFPGHAPYTLKLSDLPESAPETRRQRRRRVKRAANPTKTASTTTDGVTEPDAAGSETALAGSGADSVAAD